MSILLQIFLLSIHLKKKNLLKNTILNYLKNFNWKRRGMGRQLDYSGKFFSIIILINKVFCLFLIKYF